MSISKAAIYIIHCSCPDQQTAERIALALLEERLVACAHLLPAGRSYYHWQGAIQQSAEITLLMKSTAAQYPALQARVLDLHPYDVPEILATPVAAALPTYADWVHDMLEWPDKE